MRSAFLLLALFGALFPGFSRADEKCHAGNAAESYECAQEGAVGVTAPLLGDTIETNPAMLPSEPTPFGVEFMGSDRSPPRGKAKFGVNTVQGFDGFGFGLGTWRTGSFASPNLNHHFAGTSAEMAFSQYEKKESHGLGIRLGSSVVMPSHFLPKYVRYSFGASAGIGEVKGDFSPQIGALVRIVNLGLGYSENFTRLAKDLPRVRVSVASAGLFFKRSYFSFSYMTTRTSVNTTNAKVVSVMIPCDEWSFYGGWKWEKRPAGNDDWFRAGALRRIGSHLRLGYDHGFYRNSHSVIVQIFL